LKTKPDGFSTDMTYIDGGVEATFQTFKGGKIELKKEYA